MKEWFESLDPRERLMVAAAGIFATFAIFWFALWLPLDRSQEDLQSRIDNWQISIAELRPLIGTIQAGGSAPAVANRTQSLVVIVDNTLRARNLYSALQRSQPTATDGIRVEFENAVFDDLVLWLGELGSQFGLQVESASISLASGGERGRVNASVSLAR